MEVDSFISPVRERKEDPTHKRNYKSVDIKSKWIKREDSTFLGEDNLKKVQNFQK